MSDKNQASDDSQSSGIRTENKIRFLFVCFFEVLFNWSWLLRERNGVYERDCENFCEQYVLMLITCVRRSGGAL